MTDVNLTYFFFLFSSNLSDKDENGRFFPDRGEENFLTASLFCCSSSNLMLRLIFLLFKSISEIAASILSPPTYRGLASAAFIAICDFLIKKSMSQPSGFTTKPLPEEEITFTVTTSFIFLP